MSSENRSNALFKRADQLKRWQQSETFREPTSLKRKKSRIIFSDGCVFLAACSAGDKDEVKELLKKGVDVNTSNIDGLTALHQACIDDNLDMVEFLVECGADVNRGDNEGWTPLHATASCGFLSIARYLIDVKADLAAVNNDAELPIDICETDEMTQLMQQYIDERGIDCEKSRAQEKNQLLADAQRWYNDRHVDETPHPKTGAYSVHVAAAKGYIQALGLLLKAGVDINSQDYDGWTPLHAAAHWAQKEACQVLADNLCNMHVQNCVGQTAFDVADPSVLGLLEQLKSKQNALARERPEIVSVIKRQPVSVAKRRPSTMLLSRCSESAVDVVAEHRQRQQQQQQQQQQRRDSNTPAVKNTQQNNDVYGKNKDISGARDQTRSATTTTSTTASADSITTPSISSAATGLRAVGRRDRNGAVSTSSGAADRQRVSTVSPTSGGGGVKPEQSASATVIQTHVSPPNVRRSFVPPVRDEESETQRKAHAKRVRETRRSTQGVTLEELKSAEQYVRNQQQQQSSAGSRGRTGDTNKQSGSGGSRDETATTTTATTMSATTATTTANSSTLTERRPSWRLRLDDNDRNKFSLEEVRAAAASTAGSKSAPCTAVSDTVGRGDSGRTSQDNSTSSTSSSSQHSETSVTLSLRRRSNDANSVSALSLSSQNADTRAPLTAEGDVVGESDGTASSAANNAAAVAAAMATQAVIHRRRKPKRRSTGVVQFDPETDSATTGISKSSASSSSTDNLVSSTSDKTLNSTSTEDVRPSRDFVSSASHSSRASRAISEGVENGLVDYKKLYEEAMVDNERLRQKLSSVEDEFRQAKLQADKYIQMANSRVAAAVCDSRESRSLEKKLAEMEEELKVLDELRADNRRLRDENGALIRVISKLSK